MMAREESIRIKEENIPTIVEEYDVHVDVLKAAIGHWFVGEIGSDYWYAILPIAVYEKRYETLLQLGKTEGFLMVQRRGKQPPPPPPAPPAVEVQGFFYVD